MTTITNENFDAIFNDIISHYNLNVPKISEIRDICKTEFDNSLTQTEPPIQLYNSTQLYNCILTNLLNDSKKYTNYYNENSPDYHLYKFKFDIENECKNEQGEIALNNCIQTKITDKFNELNSMFDTEWLKFNINDDDFKQNIKNTCFQLDKNFNTNEDINKCIETEIEKNNIFLESKFNELFNEEYNKLIDYLSPENKKILEEKCQNQDIKQCLADDIYNNCEITDDNKTYRECIRFKLIEYIIQDKYKYFLNQLEQRTKLPGYIYEILKKQCEKQDLNNIENCMNDVYNSYSEFTKNNFFYKYSTVMLTVGCVFLFFAIGFTLLDKVYKIDMIREPTHIIFALIIIILSLYDRFNVKNKLKKKYS